MERNTPIPFVIFEPSGCRGHVSPGKTIIEAAQDLGADIQNVCGGQAQCGKCKVRIINPETKTIRHQRKNCLQ